MSYGNLVSQRATVRIVKTGEAQRRRMRGVPAELEDARAAWPTTGAHGRLTITTLGLTFVPSNPALGSELRMPLGEIASVELTEGRLQRFIGLRTAEHLLWVRTTSARRVAQLIATHADRARKQALVERAAERQAARARRVG